MQHHINRLISLSLSLQDDMTDSLRDYTNLPEAAPLLTILDMSARAKYVRDVEEITPAVVEQFVGDFLAEKLKPEPIWRGSPKIKIGHTIWDSLHHPNPDLSLRPSPSLSLSHLPPDSVRLLERRLTFYWHFKIFLDMFLFSWSPLSPVVPCIDDSPYSNIYGDSVGSFFFFCSFWPQEKCLVFFPLNSFFWTLEKNQRITRWTYLFSWFFALCFVCKILVVTFWFLNDVEKE